MRILNKKELLQYRIICKELEEYNITLNNNTLCGVVKGSDGDFPYIQHNVKVSGANDTESNRELLQHINKLEYRKTAIETFIKNIDDILIRKIFIQRYIRGSCKPSWQYIASSIGGDNTADGVRMIHARYLKKSRRD